MKWSSDYHRGFSKHPTFFATLLFFIFFLCTTSIKSVTAQDCKLASGGGFYYEVDDNESPDVEFWTATVTDPTVTIADIDEVIIADENFAKYFNITYREIPSSGQVMVALTAIQPDLNNLRDIDDVTFLQTENDKGIQVRLKSGEFYDCHLYLDIRDTDSQPPQFQDTSMTFTVSSTWDNSVPINFKYGAVKVEDHDRDCRFGEIDEVNIVPSGIVGVWKREEVCSSGVDGSYPHVSLVDFKFDGPVKADTFRVSVTDTGGNTGDEVEVNVEVTITNNHAPVFTGMDYNVELDSMPSAGKEVDVDIKAFDPDDPDDPDGANLVFAVLDMTDYFEFTPVNKLRFRTGVPNDFRGTTKTVRISAKEVGTPELRSSEANVNVKFPDKSRPEFTEKLYAAEPLDDWPLEADTLDVELEALVDLDPGEELEYRILDAVHFLEIRGNKLVFTEDVTEDTDIGGKFAINNVIAFRVEVVVKGDESRRDVAGVIVAFPTNPSSLTTGSTTTTTTSDSTGSTCPPCSSSETPTVSTSTLPTGSTGPVETTCPPPTTCEPCASSETPTGSTSTVSTSFGSTDPTATTCPPCSSIPTVSTSPGSTDPTATTSSDSTTTTTTCDCDCPTFPTSSSNLPSTIVTPDITTGSSSETVSTPSSACPTVPPCDCESSSPSTPSGPTPPTRSTSSGSSEPTSGSSTPTTNPGLPCTTPNNDDDDDDDCPSQIGLIIGISVLGVLSLVSLSAAGYLFWRSRGIVTPSSPYSKFPSEHSPSFTDAEHRFSLAIDSDAKPLPPPNTSSIDFGDGASYHRFNDVIEPSTGFGEGGVSGEPLPEDSLVSTTNHDVVVVEPVPVPMTTSTPLRSSIKTPKEIEPDYDNPPGNDSSRAIQPENEYEDINEGGNSKSSVEFVGPIPATLAGSQPPQEIEPDYETQPKKSNIKTPKEIEPDYEGVTPTPTPAVDRDRKASVGRVLFAPKDEVISITNEEDVAGAVDGDDGGPDDVEVDRL